MKVRLLSALVLLIAFAIGAAQTTAAPKRAGAAAARTSFGFSASAYGTRVRAGDVKSGPTSVSSIGCTNKTGASDSNTAASVEVPGILSTGAIDTTADSLAVFGGVASRATADVHAVNALQGLITADEVTAVSQTSHDGSGFHVDATGSSVVNLVVAGNSFNVTPAPNTRVDLAGLGYVILNEQHKRIASDSASLVVNMIHVVVTQTNSLGLPIGSSIIVADARSQLSGPIAAVLDGSAYGTQVTVEGGGGGIISGPSALITLGCLGTDGQTKSNSIASIVIPGVLTTGTIRTTAVGTVTPTDANGETTSRVENLNLLTALVRATTIKADAHASSNGTDFSFSDAGSTFLNLVVAGHPEINDDVAPNTQVTIVGLGTLYLHRVLQSAHKIEVRMVELVVTQENAFNLPIGTDIRIAVAEASVH